ncbi:hypothetical protein HXZ94_00800 [Empedobacter falsenii]|uniref:hypothetical protein n=1 Tax=Empedobacter falsenii TaxID=343874 RepID=UPI0025753C84|nr:hypothetical protein [Empedobacter falsenii]MDM1297044.1 hypothetical protein [Empedobacter falsenii]MDM1316837.1 hypothetical protein [Empedobacter falsenii]
MKTTLLSLALIGITYCANAQVGVGTDTPQSTLDIKEKRNATVNDASAHDGVLIPKLTKAELAAKATTAYTIDQNGAIIYVSDITAPTGSPASLAQVANINVIGFYYFDGNALVWKIFDTNTNLYNINGTLTGDRTVTQDAKKLFFVDGLTRAVTTTQNSIVFGATSSTDTNPTMALKSGARRVGVNIDNPRVSFDIHGALSSTTSAPEGLLIPKMTAGELSKKDVNTYQSRATHVSTTGQGSLEGTLVYIFPDTSNGFSVNAADPSYAKVAEVTKEGLYYYGVDDKWHAVGISTNIYNSNGTLSSNRVVSQGTNTMSFVNTTTTPTGNKVGIGSTTPTETLDVVGTARVSSLANTENKVVIADTNGKLGLLSIAELNAPKAILNTSQSSAEQKATIYDGPCYKQDDNTSSCTITINHYTSCVGFTSPVNTQIVVMNSINTTNGQFSGTWNAKFIDNKGYTNTTVTANQIAPDYPRITYSSNKTNYLGNGDFGGTCNVDLVATISNGSVKIESVKRSMYAHLVYLVGVTRSAQ